MLLLQVLSVIIIVMTQEAMERIYIFFALIRFVVAGWNFVHVLLFYIYVSFVCLSFFLKHEGKSGDIRHSCAWS